MPLLLSEWEYLNEGVANVVLVQRPSSSDRALPACVLRIAKPVPVLQHHSADLDELFAASIGRSFVAIGKPCTVSMELLAHQLRTAESLNLRSAKRVRAFPASSVNASSAARCHAVLMRDLNSAISSDELEMLSIPRALLSDHCSVEIKVRFFLLQSVSTEYVHSHISRFSRNVLCTRFHRSFHPTTPSNTRFVDIKCTKSQNRWLTSCLTFQSIVPLICQVAIPSGFVWISIMQPNPCLISLIYTFYLRVLRSLQALHANPQNNFRISNSANFNSFQSVIAAWCCTPRLGGHVFSRLRGIQYLDAWDIEVVQHVPEMIRKLDQQSAIDFTQLVRMETL
jgi:hypothetical protein